MKDVLLKHAVKMFILLSWIYVGPLCAVDDPTVDNDELRKFWKKDSLPEGLYYGFELNGERFGGGSRHWEPRWDQIKDVVSYEGKRIIEFGGNVGLCSIFLEKYRGAGSTTIVEYLPRFKQFNKKLQSVFRTHTEFHVLNVDKDPYERIVGKNYDIAICMSFMWWVKNKERFLKYLSNIPTVIYEGHDTLEVEVKRMKSAGFRYYKLIGYSKGVPVGLAKGQRPVILFSQNPL